MAIKVGKKFSISANKSGKSGLLLWKVEDIDFFEPNPYTETQTIEHDPAEKEILHESIFREIYFTRGIKTGVAELPGDGCSQIETGTV